MLSIEEVQQKLQEATDYAMNAVKTGILYKELKFNGTKYFKSRAYKHDGVYATFGKTAEIYLFSYTLYDDKLEICFSSDVRQLIYEETVRQNARKKAEVSKTKKSA